MAGTTWRMGGVEWLLLVALGLLWGWTYFFGKLALAELGPLTLVLGRVGIAALALDLCVWAAGHRLPRALRAWGAFALLGALNNLIPFSLIFWGQTRIASGLAAILNASTPLFTAVLAHLLTRDERLTPGRLAGVLLGLGGVALMVGPAALAGMLGCVVTSACGTGCTSSTTVASMSGISSSGAAGGASSEKLEREGSPCTPGSAGFWKKSSSGGGGSSRALAAGKNWVAPSDGASGTSGTSGSAIS